MTLLSTLIDTLICDDVLFDITHNSSRFLCSCGSRINRYSIRRHIKTHRHLSWLKKIEEKVSQKRFCYICYFDKDRFYTCTMCKNDLCMDCYNNPLVKKCPFCRHKI